MHHRSLSEALQGVSGQQGTTALRTTQDGASSWGSRLRRRRGSARCGLSPPSAAPLWAWLLLGALVVPGAWSSLNEEEEELLVELHNRYRGAVVPPASAMMPLKWDPSLKVVAENYAAKCIWNHNPELEETGENLFAGTKPLDLQEALKDWFLEHQNYDFNNNSCDEDKMCGHYTQMVWADTHRVGCAMHHCNDMEGLNWGKSYFLVCNYYPAGNYEDVRPYVEGDWCSGCPEYFQKCENNLCAEDTAEDAEDDGDDGGDDGEDEEGTDIPATTEPFHLPDQVETEAEAVVPPPATTDVYVPPATTTAPITTTPPPTTTPSPPTTPVPPSISTSSAEDSEETEPEDTPAPGTLPPRAPATTAGRHQEVDIQEEEEEEEEEVKEEKEKMKPAEKAEREVTVKIFQNQKGSRDAASVCAPSLLLACLMGVLALRL
ncbi:uncharacterized protein LOC141799452 [Halichoeres trimaculatus]|uniref:uncharacterized protein LOC141799452 n=1 Tax=Halichoeres trimaculatus TaxID=147232 RepID=UPI003D9EF503